ncbi:MAG: DNA ligase D [Pseudobacter sp.]|uniref:DNA ligase D n=1 Tax=Pseudobacter sp. TaxID=2045420 RepID=UPI003F7EA41B
MSKTKSGKPATAIRSTRPQQDAAPLSYSIQDLVSNLSVRKKQAFPKNIQPMLASLASKAFDDAAWQYEIKWDGYRAISYLNKGSVDIVSRNSKSFKQNYYPINEALEAWTISAVIDGEIIVVNKKGRADFAALQEWRSEADGQLRYYLFDLLWLEGFDLTGLPLSERTSLLKKLIPPDNEWIQFSASFDTTGTTFFKQAQKLGLEGIMAKKKDSIYEPGKRTKNWLKIKTERTQEAVIAGYTRNEGTSKLFSSLLLGIYENRQLVYIGPVGTGFTNQQQTELMKAFKPLRTKTCPFPEVPEYNKPSRFRPNPPKASVTWLKPELVAEVSYQTVAPGGVLRHPSFKGLRPDKKAKEAVAEKAFKPENVMKQKKTPPKKAINSGNRKSLLNPTDATQVRNILGTSFSFNNVQKVYWPKEGYTKGDMLNYYYQVAPYIMPYLKHRPQSLNRFPNGINGKSFYQKDLTAQASEWMQLFPYTTSEGEHKNYLVPEDERALLFMANMGAIEMNPWNSTVQKPDNPDWCMIDLDPSPKQTFEQVIKAALTTKEVLDQLKVPGYPKTSGSTGIHIYIPLNQKYTYDECQLFGKLIATRVHEALPDFTSIERLTKNRRGKMYIDYLQNRPKATLAAPYSLRPKPGAPVSMPLFWEEVKPGLKITDWNIKNALARIRSEGDIFKPVLGKGIDMRKVLKQLNDQE